MHPARILWPPRCLVNAPPRGHLGGVRALLLLTATLFGCPGDSAPEVSLIEQAEQQKEAETLASAPAAARPTGYTKPEGLHIDLPYLGGRRLAELEPAAIDEQLGGQLGREELPENEEHFIFEKAEVWTYDGRIYRVLKELAHPMDIPTALGTSGFPLNLGRPTESKNEARWNHVWNQRRVRLLKSPTDDRLYVAIDVWRFIPKDLY